MRSVPRTIDRKGEHLSRCDVCGVMWLRSALSRGRDGLLRCEHDRPGRDAVTLSELTANRAAALAAKLGAGMPADGAVGDPSPDRTVIPAVAETPTFVAAGTLVGGTGTTTVSWPEHARDDVGLLFVETANQVLATPNGWAAVPNATFGSGTGGTATAGRLSCFRRRALSSTEPAVTLADSGDHTISVILTFRGCTSTREPINASNGSPEGGSTLTCIGITTTIDRCLIVAAASHMLDTSGDLFGSASNANLIDLTLRFSGSDNIGNGGGIIVVTGSKITAGATGITNITLNTGLNNTNGGAVTIALAPITPSTPPLTPSGGPYPGIARRRTVEDVYANDVPTYADPNTLTNKPGF